MPNLLANRELPDDLPGGWEFKEPFKPLPLDVGQIWRKCGPIGAIKIEQLQFPGSPGYDRGLPGVSARRSVTSRGQVVWGKRRCFIPGNEEVILGYLQQSGFALANNERNSA